MKNEDVFNTLERVYKKFKEVKGYEIPYVAREKIFNAVLGFTLYWSKFITEPSNVFSNGDSKAQELFSLLISKIEDRKGSEEAKALFISNILSIIEDKLLICLTENFGLVCKFSVDYDAQYDLLAATKGVEGISLGSFPIKTSSSIWISTFNRDENDEITNLDITARSVEGYGSKLRAINEKGELV